jgi:nucleotide-binding universal stress UspA family protein
MHGACRLQTREDTSLDDRVCCVLGLHVATLETMFTRVMLATDFSTPSTTAAIAAFQLAHAFGAEATLTHVVGSSSPFSKEDAGEALAALQEERFGTTVAVERLVLEAERPSHAICTAAEEKKTDLIVAGRHGEHRLAERFIGTTTERIARHAPCSVYVAHPTRREQPVMFKHIVVASDLSDHAISAVKAAGELALKFEAYVTLTHVFDLFPAMELLQEPYDLHTDDSFRGILSDKLENLRKQHLSNVPAEARVLRDKSTVAGLCDLASDVEADLLVAGTHGLSGVTRLLLGSVAERLIRHAPCSVLITR